MPAADEPSGLVARLVPPSPAAEVSAIRDGPHDDPHKSIGRPGLEAAVTTVASGARVARDPAGRGGSPGPGVTEAQLSRLGWPVVVAGMTGGA
jgi:hypothetical protein